MKIFDFEEIKNNLKIVDETIEDDITPFEFTEEELKNGGVVITLKEKEGKNSCVLLERLL